MWFSLTFPVCSKFPDFSLTGKCLPIFPGFPVQVGTLSMWKISKLRLEKVFHFMSLKEFTKSFSKETSEAVFRTFWRNCDGLPDWEETLRHSEIAGSIRGVIRLVFFFFFKKIMNYRQWKSTKTETLNISRLSHRIKKYQVCFYH